MIALTVLVIGLFRQVRRLEAELAELRRATPADASPASPVDDVQLASTEEPNLVAVYIRADWCPRCPIVGPIYGEVVQKYADDDVLFVEFDVTDPARRHQTRLLADVLGVKWLPRNQRQSGMVTLIDRARRTVLATLTGPDQLDELESTLTHALDRSGG